jgi:ankyrin repeat protein
MTITQNKWENALLGNVTPCLEALNNGADVNDPKASPFGPPLVSAALTGLADVVRVLLEHGADVSLRGPSGHTALHEAASAGYEDVCRQLLEAGADPAATERNGFTPLMLAASKGREEVCKLLVKHGAGVDGHSGDGLTALHYALRNLRLNTCRALLELGADPGVIPEGGKSGYITPFMFAAKKNYHEVMQLMIETGRVDPFLVAPDGSTAASVARNAPEALKIVLSLQAEAAVVNEVNAGVGCEEGASRKSPSVGML